MASFSKGDKVMFIIKSAWSGEKKVECEVYSDSKGGCGRSRFGTGS